MTVTPLRPKRRHCSRCGTPMAPDDVVLCVPCAAWQDIADAQQQMTEAFRRISEYEADMGLTDSDDRGGA